MSNESFQLQQLNTRWGNVEVSHPPTNACSSGQEARVDVDVLQDIPSFLRNAFEGEIELQHSSNSYMFTKSNKSNDEVSGGSDEASDSKDRISSRLCDYLVEDIKGQGCYGKVLKCIEMKTKTPVAVKFQEIESAEQELNTIIKIQALDPDKSNLIRFYECFPYRGGFCMVYELLDTTLLDFVMQKSHLSLEEIRLILGQLLVALQALESIGIIHSDIKLDNIMLVNHQEQPFRIKLIDFGCAFPSSVVEAGYICQPDILRAPEVILGLKFTEAIDMWSVGLLTAFLLLGFHPYAAYCEYDLLRLITDTLGEPPVDLLNIGEYTKTFFTKQGDIWKMRSPENYRNEIGKQCSDGVKCHFKTLHHMKDYYKETHGLDHPDLEDFVDLLEKMLRVDPRERVKPTEALQHHFITKQRPVNTNSFCAMDLCTSDKEVNSDGGHTVSESSYRGLDNAKSEGPLLSAHCVNSRPCSDIGSSTDTSHFSRGLVNNFTRDILIISTDTGGVVDPDSYGARDSLSADATDEAKIQPLERIQYLFSTVFRVLFDTLKKVLNFLFILLRNTFCRTRHTCSGGSAVDTDGSDSDGSPGGDPCPDSPVISASRDARSSLTAEARNVDVQHFKTI